MLIDIRSTQRVAQVQDKRTNLHVALKIIPVETVRPNAHGLGLCVQ